MQDILKLKVRSGDHSSWLHSPKLPPRLRLSIQSLEWIWQREDSYWRLRLLVLHLRVIITAHPQQGMSEAKVEKIKVSNNISCLVRSITLILCRKPHIKYWSVATLLYGQDASTHSDSVGLIFCYGLGSSRETQACPNDQYRKQNRRHNSGRYVSSSHPACWPHICVLYQVG